MIDKLNEIITKYNGIKKELVDSIFQKQIGK